MKTARWWSLLSRLVASDSLWPHGLQHVRLSCPSPSPGACSNSCPLSRWCRPTIPSSVIPFFSCLQSFPVSGFFPVMGILHQMAKVLELQLQHQSIQWILRVDSFRIDWFDCPAGQRTVRRLLQHHNSKGSILQCSGFFMVHLSHPYMTTGKTTALTIWTFLSSDVSAF